MLNYGEKNRETLINLVTRNFSRFYTRPEVKESSDSIEKVYI